MLNSIQFLYRLLSVRERFHASLLLVIMTLSAGAEMLSLASIIPLLTLLSDPGILEGDSLIGQIYQTGWFGSLKNFFFFLTGLIFLGSLLRIAMLFLTEYAISRYALGLEHRWSVRLLRAYLHRPYEYFAQNNSADMGNFVLQEVGRAVGGTVNPLLTALSKLIVIGALMTLVILSSPMVALILMLSLVTIYGLCAMVILRPLQKRGALRVEASNRRHKHANEALQGIKEAKLGQLEDVYAKRFDEATFDFIGHVLFHNISKMVPRNIAELTLIAAIFMALFVNIGLNPAALETVIPTVGVIGLAGLRLLPAAQALYDSIHALNYHQEAVSVLVQGLKNTPKQKRIEAASPLTFQKNICAQGVSYRHAEAGKDALQNQNFIIEKGQIIGITGETGAGKSTLLDLLLGLREPTAGQILVDGKSLVGEHLRQWQSAVGYVPQHIYLVDDSIAANIALGIEENKIDFQRIAEVCNIACLGSFIEQELPAKYNTVVGENGIRLSGGQRQRLGLARALYKLPKVLFLDEATSALDYETEAKVMENLHTLGKDVTLIMIAHRTATLETADQIINLEMKKEP